MLAVTVAVPVTCPCQYQRQLPRDLEVDEAGKYPYQRAYLPYNRLADGTVHDW